MHTFEQVSADKVSERISFLLDDGWEILNVQKHAVTLRVKDGNVSLTFVK